MTIRNFGRCHRNRPLTDFTDVFSISGRGTVATGRVERGVITKGSDVEVIGLGATFKTTLTGVEMFRKELDRGEAGDNMGALLRGVKREQLRRGMVVIAPGSMKPVRKFQAQIYVSNYESDCLCSSGNARTSRSSRRRRVAATLPSWKTIVPRFSCAQPT